jgi:predicted RNA-binding Zn-ribbon protein involved in translation (DUF1610 family)
MGSKLGRKGQLNVSEILTLIVFRFDLGFKNWKDFYTFLTNYHSQDFHLPNYQNFIVMVNTHMSLATQILNLICQLNNHAQVVPISAIDSSDLPVCANKRIFHHKVCRKVAQRYKCSKGWFFGFKLHIVTDMVGNLLNLRITPANIDDRTMVISMMATVRCLILLADAGYISPKVAIRLLVIGIWYLTCVRKTMKRIITWWQRQLLKKRQIVETVFSVLKYRLGLTTSLPRSVKGHLAHYVHTCLAYQVRKFLRSNPAYSLTRV